MFDAGRLSLQFDSKTGALVSLKDKQTGHDWASPQMYDRCSFSHVFLLFVVVSVSLSLCVSLNFLGRVLSCTLSLVM